MGLEVDGGATGTGGGVGPGGGGATVGGTGGGPGQGTGGSGDGTGSGGRSGSGGTFGSGGAVGTGGRTSGGSGGSTGSGGRGTGGSVGTGGSTTGSGGSTTGGTGGGPGGAGGTTVGCGKAPPQMGQFQKTITVAGAERGYFVSIPTTYNSAMPQALVFGYHGSGWTGKMMRGYLDMEKAPLVGRSVFVYPDGIGGVWDLSPNGKDMAFFDAIVAQMAADYCVDMSRIFVSGQSFGGMMSNAVGCARGNVVRAIAPIAGSGPNSTSACKGPVAAWIVHGEDDANVSFTSGVKSKDYWVMKNGCTTMTVPGTPIKCQNFQGCSAGHPVIWCTHVGETGHQEPSWAKPAIREFFMSF